MPGEDDELVNEGMYGKSFAQYLQQTLVQRGYQVPAVACEDWGWWVSIAGLHFACGIGVYGRRRAEKDDLDLCVTVLTPKGKKWSWSRFRFVDTSAEVDRLHQTLLSICDADEDVTVLAVTPDFPLD